MYPPLRPALCALLLSTLLLASANAAETAAPAPEMTPRPPGETPEPPDIDTGQPGRTSLITGSDMEVEEETTSGGQSRGDAILQTDGSQPDAGAAYETTSPERESPPLPDDPLGAETTGRPENGMSQGSTSQEAEEDAPDQAADDNEQ
ncbi:hypothetical protein [Halomonas korlensis]|uniref:Uncharacterized protein n=1 Tax=Halomonas korlensis TaxID=463301 RepID=A0A1I7GXS2_9GAMM|nr:hypothetical protein [Halomonas korlensis]SFU53247.1 hypothetical protein SAMN04487955_103326 [Halomonas korlensis]